MGLWFEEGAEERQVLGPFREFLKAEVAPGAAERDRTGAFPWDLVRKLAEFGVFGALVPEAYGGAGLSTRLFARMVEAIAYYDGALALTVASHNSLATGHILLAGSEAQKEAFLPKLASGEALGAWGLTEPGSGSDAAALKTKAEKVEGVAAQRHQAVHHPRERGRGLRRHGPHRPPSKPRAEAPGHLRLRLLPPRAGAKGGAEGGEAWPHRLGHGAANPGGPLRARGGPFGRAGKRLLRRLKGAGRGQDRHRRHGRGPGPGRLGLRPGVRQGAGGLRQAHRRV